MSKPAVGWPELAQRPGDKAVRPSFACAMTHLDCALKVVALRIRFSRPKALRLVDRPIEPYAVVHGRDPIRRDVLVLVPGVLFRTGDLEMATFDLVDDADACAIAVNYGH